MCLIKYYFKFCANIIQSFVQGSGGGGGGGGYGGMGGGSAYGGMGGNGGGGYGSGNNGGGSYGGGEGGEYGGGGGNGGGGYGGNEGGYGGGGKYDVRMINHIPTNQPTKPLYFTLQRLPCPAIRINFHTFTPTISLHFNSYFILNRFFITRWRILNHKPFISS